VGRPSDGGRGGRLTEALDTITLRLLRRGRLGGQRKRSSEAEIGRRIAKLNWLGATCDDDAQTFACTWPRGGLYVAAKA